MKVLFVSSGRTGKVNELIINQGISLQRNGIEIDYFYFRKGFWGYFTGVFEIRKLLKTSNYDLIHAHYSFSGFAASFAGKKPLVVSLLGSDAYKGFLIRLITRFFSKYFWKVTIVKTPEMKSLLHLKKVEIIPNGVDIERFMPIPKKTAREYIRFPLDKILILFISDPSRHEKNFGLALSAFELIKQDNFELLPVFNKPNEIIPYYLNAADAILLTSKREGSVNVIKEAMACNTPIVSTDVGDVRRNLEGINGCYVCDSDPESLAMALKKVLESKNSIDSRSRLIELRLDSKTIASKVTSVYKQILSNEA